MEEAARLALAEGGAPSPDLLLPVSALPSTIIAAVPPGDCSWIIQLGGRVVPGPAAGAPAFASQAAFERNWRVTTWGQLDGLDWNNVIAAGGAVLACAMSGGGENASDADAASMRQHLCRTPPAFMDAELTSDAHTFLSLHGRDAPGDIARADIDLWLYGLSSPEAAAAKVAHICDVLIANAAKRGDTIGIFRTRHSVTFASAYPRRPVQVILSPFSSPLEVLLGFDLDAPSLAYDGARLRAAPRALRAVAAGVNVLRTSALNSRGSERLFKYAKRGYCAAVPRRSLADATGPAAAADAFASAKLSLLRNRHVFIIDSEEMAGRAEGVSILSRWRDQDVPNVYPHEYALKPPPETWMAGIAFAGSMGDDLPPVRFNIYTAGPGPEDDYGVETEEPGEGCKQEFALVIRASKTVASVYKTCGGAAAKPSAPLPDFPDKFECVNGP
jgi:hypothetical protein